VRALRRCGLRTRATQHLLFVCERINYFIVWNEKKKEKKRKKKWERIERKKEKKNRKREGIT
jgi:hypothetical protein